MTPELQDSESLARIWAEVRPDRGSSYLAVVLSVLTLVCAIGLIAVSGWLISRAWQQPPIAYLTLAIVGVRAFGIGKGVFKYFERLVSHSNALRGLTRLRIALVDRIAVVAPVGTAQFRNGDAMRRLVTDVDNMAEYGLRAVLPRTAAVIVGLIVVVFAAFLVPLVGVVLLCGLLLAGVVAPMITAAVGKRHVAAETQLQGDLAAHLNWQFQAIREISAANAQDRIGGSVVGLDRQIREAEKQSAHGLGWASALSTLAQGLCLIGVILVAVPAVSAGELDGGVYLATVVLLPLVAFELVAGLSAAALATLRARASSYRLTKILDEPDTIPELKDPLPILGESDPDRKGAVVELNDVSVVWPGSESPAVENVSFTMHPNEVTALIGPSGGGKSTLAAALVRFVDYSGVITFNGVETKRLSGDDLRKVMVLSNQDTYLFNNTIAENVRLARVDASDDEVVEALRRAGAGPWIRGLPAGIHTMVGQYGTQVSGGQRQRIALARIELAQPPVVIFDEPTAHLDRQSAWEIMESILENQSGRTTLLITHNRVGLDRVGQVVELAKR